MEFSDIINSGINTKLTTRNFFHVELKWPAMDVCYCHCYVIVIIKIVTADKRIDNLFIIGSDKIKFVCVLISFQIIALRKKNFKTLLLLTINEENCSVRKISKDNLTYGYNICTNVINLYCAKCRLLIDICMNSFNTCVLTYSMKTEF